MTQDLTSDARRLLADALRLRAVALDPRQRAR
jgi:hypothetical protein